MRVFFNKLENLDLHSKVGFSSIKIYKSGCFAGFFLSARPGIDNKISKLSSKKILPLNKKCLYLQSVLHEEATPVMKHQDGSVAQLDRATAF